MSFLIKLEVALALCPNHMDWEWERSGSLEKSGVQGPSERRMGAAPLHRERLRTQERGQRKNKVLGNWAGEWTRRETYSL